MSRWQDGQRSMFGAVTRIAAEKFLREARQIEQLARCRLCANDA
nr:hypothetical protein [Sphingobium yanoikuyae]